MPRQPPILDYSRIYDKMKTGKAECLSIVFGVYVMNERIGKIIELEWNMFGSVNGEYHVSCQDDRRTFDVMRAGQYEAWSDAALESYYADLTDAAWRGHNIAREKYIRMMKHTAPADYENFKNELPEVSAEKEALVAEIWTRMAAETEEMRRDYPLLALSGRTLYAKDEQDWPSVETYQTSELLTYSENTLRLLLEHIKDLEAEGRSFAYEIQLHTVTGLGYKDMSTAEQAMSRMMFKPCDTCGVDYAAKGCPGGRDS